jgi:hypothetical protein
MADSKNWDLMQMGLLKVSCHTWINSCSLCAEACKIYLHTADSYNYNLKHFHRSLRWPTSKWEGPGSIVTWIFFPLMVRSTEDAEKLRWKLKISSDSSSKIIINNINII